MAGDARSRRLRAAIAIVHAHAALFGNAIHRQKTHVVRCELVLDARIAEPDDLKPGEHFDYPVFKGFYSGVRWLQLNTSEGPITAMVDQSRDSPIYVQILTPKTPPSNLQGQTGVPFPNAGVSFLHAI